MDTEGEIIDDEGFVLDNQSASPGFLHSERSPEVKKKRSQFWRTEFCPSYLQSGLTRQECVAAKQEHMRQQQQSAVRMQFYANGNGRFPVSCSYAHSPDEVQCKKFMTVYKTRHCPAWEQNQQCENGQSCTFLHDELPAWYVPVGNDGVPLPNAKFQEVLVDLRQRTMRVKIDKNAIENKCVWKQQLLRLPVAVDRLPTFKRDARCSHFHEITPGRCPLGINCIDYHDEIQVKKGGLRVYILPQATPDTGNMRLCWIELDKSGTRWYLSIATEDILQQAQEYLKLAAERKQQKGTKRPLESNDNNNPTATKKRKTDVATPPAQQDVKAVSDATVDITSNKGTNAAVTAVTAVTDGTVVTVATTATVTATVANMAVQKKEGKKTIVVKKTAKRKPDMFDNNDLLRRNARTLQYRLRTAEQMDTLSLLDLMHPSKTYLLSFPEPPFGENKHEEPVVVLPSAQSHLLSSSSSTVVVASRTVTPVPMQTPEQMQSSSATALSFVGNTPMDVS